MKFPSLILAALAVCGAAHAGDEGRILYERHCAVCHGMEGGGDGPMAGVLLIKPADLAALSSGGGTFPTARVIARIDGQEALVSHGSPMPVYGPFFEGPEVAITLGDGEHVRTTAAIAVLVEHLKELQE